MEIEQAGLKLAEPFIRSEFALMYFSNTQISHLCTYFDVPIKSTISAKAQLRARKESDIRKT
jgi:hypothetical protein